MAAWPRTVVEIVLLTLVAAAPHKAFLALTAAVLLALQGVRTLRITVTGFTAFGAKAKVVDLASVTMLAGNARLALALPSSDVALAVGGAQCVAVAPLTATSALEVEEARLTGTAVPPGDMRQALTLPGHLIATRLLIHSAVGIAVTSFALVSRIGGQGVPKEAIFAAVAVEASGVVDALEALACLAVAVPHSIGIDVVVALAEATRPHSTIFTQWVSKIGIITQLTPLACSASLAAGAHNLLRAGHDGTA